MKLKPHSWEKYQNYKTRRPPWIKLHADILENPNIMMLADASICLLMLAWLYAAKTGNDGVFEVDLEKMSFVLRRTITLDSLKVLVSKGLLDIVEGSFDDACKQMLADACLETETETETETDHKEICPETETAPVSRPFLIFPTDGPTSKWILTEKQIEDWYKLYPHLDVHAECRKAYGWIDANPANRKTANGMKRFLSGWLGRANDRGGKNGNGQTRFETRDEREARDLNVRLEQSKRVGGSPIEAFMPTDDDL